MVPWLPHILAIAASAAPAPGAAKWVVDWGEQRCSLLRETGGTAPQTLMVRTVPGSNGAELWLFDAQWTGPDRLMRDPVDLSLEPSGFQVTQGAISVRYRELEGLAVTNVEPKFVEKISGATALRIKRGKRILADIPMPGSARAVASLHACEDEVMSDWGFDPAVMRSLSRPPTPVIPAAHWFTDRDYPMEAIRLNQQGGVLTRLIVGTDGRVAECLVVDGSGVPILDSVTCRVLVERGRYKPALTAAGDPVRALTSVRIQWRIP